MSTQDSPLRYVGDVVTVDAYAQLKLRISPTRLGQIEDV
jgi:hypothetical protein